MSAYYASWLELSWDSFFVLLCMATPIGDSLVVDKVYRSRVVTILEFDKQADLIIFDMMHLDVIMGMDWLSYYYGVMDFFLRPPP